MRPFPPNWISVVSGLKSSGIWSLLHLTVLPHLFPNARALTPHGRAQRPLLKKPHLGVPAKEQRCRKDTSPIILEIRGPRVCPAASSHLAGIAARGNAAPESHQATAGAHTVMGSRGPERW